MKSARPLSILEGLYENSKAYMKPPMPIWIHQGLYEASKTYMKPARPIWSQQVYMEPPCPIWSQQSLYGANNAYLEPARLIWSHQGVYGTSKAYVMPRALVASLNLSNRGGTIELDERRGNLGSCHQPISYLFPDKEIDKQLIVKESHYLVRSHKFLFTQINYKIC